MPFLNNPWINHHSFEDFKLIFNLIQSLNCFFIILRMANFIFWIMSTENSFSEATVYYLRFLNRQILEINPIFMCLLYISAFLVNILILTWWWRKNNMRVLWILTWLAPLNSVLLVCFLKIVLHVGIDAKDKFYLI